MSCPLSCAQSAATFLKYGEHIEATLLHVSHMLDLLLPARNWTSSQSGSAGSVTWSKTFEPGITVHLSASDAFAFELHFIRQISA